MNTGLGAFAFRPSRVIVLLGFAAIMLVPSGNATGAHKTPGVPETITTGGGGASAVVGQQFAAPVSATIEDSEGDPVEGVPVTFSLPAGEDAGGNFPGEEVVDFTGATNALGVVTTPAITAGETAGDWVVEVAVGDEEAPSLTASIPLSNLPDVAAEVGVEVDPIELPADGQSTATAEISVADAFGNAIVGHSLSISTGGGPTATAPVLGEEGVYASTLTASTTPGVFIIKVTDTTAEPDLSGEFELTQTDLPPTSISISLSPNSIPADGVTQSKATVTVRNEIGGPVSGAEVTVTSSGEQAVDSTIAAPGGIYTALILSNTVPGVSTVTATIESAEPELTASAGLIQFVPVIKPPRGEARPVVRFRSGPRGKIRGARVRFTFASVSGDVRGFQCRIDGRGWAACRSPKRLKVDRGRHVFRVRGVATDGSKGKAIKRKFKRIG